MDITAGDAHLVIMDWGEEATCSFTCPRCRREVRKPVAPPLVQLLIQMGVEYDHPDGMAPPPPPLSAADLERFLQELTIFDG